MQYFFLILYMRILESHPFSKLADVWTELNRPIPKPHGFLTNLIPSSVDPFTFAIIFSEAGSIIVSLTLKSELLSSLSFIIDGIKVPLSFVAENFISSASYNITEYVSHNCSEAMLNSSGFCTELFWNKFHDYSQFSNCSYSLFDMLYKGLTFNAPSLSILGPSILYATSLNIYNNITVYMANPAAYNRDYTSGRLFELRRIIEERLQNLPNSWNPVHISEAHLMDRGLSIIVHAAGNYDIIVPNEHIVRHTRPGEFIQNIALPGGNAPFDVVFTPGEIDDNHTAAISTHERSVESAIASIRIIARQLARARHIAYMLHENNLLSQTLFDEFNNWVLDINPQILAYINANTGNYITDEDYISMQEEALQAFVLDFSNNT